MNTILLLLIFAGLVGLLLVVFYMLDRVNELHKHSGVSKNGHTPFKLDETFGGLSGKNLWDAMTGVPMPGWSVGQIEALKLRYEAILQKHIEMLFEDGQLDGREGFRMPVRCDRVIATLRGEIESWMPQDYASAIYRSGHDRSTKPKEKQASIRETINQTGNALFAATGLPPHSLANLLMPLASASTTQAESPEEAAALALAAPVDDLAGHPQQGDPFLALSAQPEGMNLSPSVTASADKAAEPVAVAVPEAPVVQPAAAKTPPPAKT